MADSQDLSDYEDSGNSDISDLDPASDNELGDNDGQGDIDPLERAQRIGDWMAGLIFESNDNTHFEGFDTDWTDKFHSTGRKSFDAIQTGCIPEMAQEASAENFLELTLTYEVWELLVNETNRYAEHELAGKKEHKKMPKWRPVEITEMKKFIALCFAMGILKLPRRRMYWRKRKRFFRIPGFSEVMTRSRFEQIWRFLHVADSSASPDRNAPLYDKMWRIRPLINLICNQCRVHYVPDKELCIGESMVLFKDRLIKPSTKCGLKAWVIAEAKSGYILNFEVYSGSKGQKYENGLAERVVLELTEPYYGTWRCIYFDNFYTSATVINSLLSLGLYACGTVCKKGDIPKDILPVKRGVKFIVNNRELEQGDTLFRQKNDVVACLWMDKKPIMLLSSEHDAERMSEVKRSCKDGTGKKVPCPLAVHSFNKFMGGVDKADQMMGYYKFNHHSKNWTRRLIFWLLEVAVYNAYVLAKDSPTHKQRYPDLLEFREELIENLIGVLESPDVGSDAGQPEGPAFPPGNIVQGHRHKQIFEKRKTCHICSIFGKEGKRRPVTTWGCEKCKVPLCRRTDCFDKYHD